MATIFTHALVGATLGQAGSIHWKKDWRFWCVAIFCSIFPDVDVVGFRMGIHYGDLWGHRGMTHSLLFAGALALGMTFAFWNADHERWKLALLLFVVSASHGVLDAFTNGGLGVAFFSPFNTRRYFLPWRPIRVSPIGTGRFFSARGLDVLRSEILWIWLPMLVVGGLIWIFRSRRQARAAAAA